MAAWVLITMYIIFSIIKKTIGLRVSEKEELDGLDIHEHGLTSAYAGFAISDPTYAELDVNENTDLGEDDITKASPEKIAAAVKAGIRKINFGTDVCCSLLDGIRAVDPSILALDLFMQGPTCLLYTSDAADD